MQSGRLAFSRAGKDKTDILEVRLAKLIHCCSKGKVCMYFRENVFCFICLSAYHRTNYTVLS